MVKRFYVIMEEQAVRDAAEEGDEKARLALEEIERIKASTDLFIESNYTFFSLNEVLAWGVPPNDEGLQVLVAGAFGNQCCAIDVATLRRVGYNADFHKKGIYDVGRIVNDFLIPQIKEQIPEYPLSFN